MFKIMFLFSCIVIASCFCISCLSIFFNLIKISQLQFDWNDLNAQYKNMIFENLILLSVFAN